MDSIANNEQYHYFINSGDLVSASLVQYMSEDTFNNRVNMGHYIYSPLGAHSITQWYSDKFNNHIDTGVQPTQNFSIDDVAEYQQDNAVTQAQNLS